MGMQTEGALAPPEKLKSHESDDAYRAAESFWRTVRDYESIQKPPLSENPFRAELLEDPRNDSRCRPIERQSSPEAYHVDGPAGAGVFLVPNAIDSERQLELLGFLLQHCSSPPNRSNVWPPPGDDDADDAAERLRSGLGLFLESGAADENAKAAVAKLRWVVIGRQYNWSSRTYDSKHAAPDLPVELAGMATDIVEALPLPSMRPLFDAAICNLYHAAQRPSDRLGGHKDDVEPDAVSPLVTISVGLPCIFLLGGNTRSERPLPLLLRSGSALILSGGARHAIHGVPMVLVPPRMQLRGRVWRATEKAGGNDLALPFPYGSAASAASPIDDGSEQGLDEGNQCAKRREAVSWLAARARVSLSIRHVGRPPAKAIDQQA